MKKTLGQVIIDIKQGEVWRTTTTKIYFNNRGELIIKDIDYMNNGDINILKPIVVLNLESEYWLDDK